MIRASALFVVWHMPFVFFGYGLAFFLFGTSILFQSSLRSDKGSAFTISHYLHFLGLFGVLHGLQEWADMFPSLGEQCWPFAPRYFELLGAYMGTASYVFLFLFCIHALGGTRMHFRRVKLVATWVVIALTALLLVKHFSPVALQALAVEIRYLFAFPASMATAFVLFTYSGSPEMVNLINRRTVWCMKGLAATFAVYAVVAGLVVPPRNFFPASIINTGSFLQWVGVPVQVIRALCAIAAAVLVSGVMRMFEAEREAQRQAEIRRRLGVIGEMNHHIRNSLQTISYSRFANDESTWEIINGAIDRIDWTLREILPKL